MPGLRAQNLIVSVVLAALVGCADPVDPPKMDAGVDASIDAGPEDGGPRDADAALDAGVVDAEVDAGLLIDAGSDAGTMDATADAGLADAASIDSGAAPLFALLPVNGANWSDHVQGAWREVGPSLADLPCDAAQRTMECVHGGELRVIDSGLAPNCSGLTIRDERGAFDWICDDSGASLLAISVGLKPSVKLSALLDLGRNNWAANAVIINDGSGDIYTSPSAVWWNNPVLVDNDGLMGTEAQSGTIYLVTMATRAHYLLNADSVSLVVAPGTILSGPGNGSNVVQVNGDYAWIEGHLDAEGDGVGLDLGSADHSVVRGLYVENARTGQPTAGVMLFNAWNNRLSDLTLIANTTGVSIEPNPGVMSKRNRISGVKGSGNTSALIRAGRGNILWDISGSNHRFSPIAAASSSHLALMTLSNNGGGVYAFSSFGSSIYLAATIAHTQDRSSSAAGNALQIASSSYNYFGGFAVMNSRQFGVRAAGGNEHNVFADLYSGHNQNAAISILVATDTTFTGVLKVNGNCEATGASPGLIARTCSDTGVYGSSTYGGQNSDAVLSRPAAISASFIAKVTGDDLANPHDNGTPGLAAFDTITEWVTFDNPYRSYGTSDARAFPSGTQRGACESGTDCQIWDWSLAATGDVGDWGIDGQPRTADDRAVLLEAWPLPTGDDIWTHTYDFSSFSSPQTDCEELFGATWSSDSCQITFLRRAIEIMGDRIGNDNLLCEGAETCLFTPNIGAYQGHGALVSAGTFEDSIAGGLTGITLLRYATNGQ